MNKQTSNKLKSHLYIDKVYIMKHNRLHTITSLYYRQTLIQNHESTVEDQLERGKKKKKNILALCYFKKKFS